MENVEAVFYMMSGKTGELVYVNSAYEKIWKRPIAEIKEHPESWLDAVHSEDINSVIKFFENGSGELQYRINLPDGSTRWIMDRLFPILDEKGEIVYMCGMAADITERKQDEKELKEREKSYRTLAENLPASVYRLYLREKGKMEFFNNIIEKISGYTKDELRKGEICSIDPFIVSEDRPQVVETVTNAIKNNSEFEVEYRFIRKDGVIKYFHEKGKPVMGEDGKPLFIEGVIFDITERNKLETNLTTAAKIAKLGYWEFDVKSENFIFDDQYYRLIHGSSTEKQGSNVMSAEEFVRRFVHPDDSKMVGTKLQEAILSTDSEYLGKAETRVFRDNGDITNVMVQLKVAKDQFGHAHTVYGVNQDITERKLAEKELAESEERYKLLFQSAAEGILVVDVETKEFKLANKAVCQMFGYSEKEMTGLNIKDLHPKESLAYVLSEFESQAKGNRPFSSNIPCLKKDGKIFYANIYNAIVYIGNRKHNIGFFTDITSQKEANEKVNLFRTLINHSNDSIELIDFETGRFLDCNKKASQELGYTRKEFLSLKLFHIDPTLTESAFSEFKKLIRNSDSLLIESTHRRKDGTEFPVEINIKYLQLDREYIIGVVRDITKRKHEEQELIKAKEKAEAAEIQLLSILENSPTGFAISTISTGEVRYLNKAFSDVYHIPKELCHNVESFFEYVYGDQMELGNKILDDLKSCDPERMKWNLVPITDKTTKKVHYVSAANILLKDLDLMISSVWDITSQVENEEKLIVALNKATESDRLKSAFLSNMSHEIRTPMNGILGFAGLLKDPDLTGEKQQKYIKIIEKSGERMLNIISEIIDISKIESGQMEVTYKDTNINKLIENIYNILKLDADVKRLNLSFKISLLTKETIIKTDSEKLYSILTNLVKNAIKYTDKGSIEFGFKKSGNYLEFYVKDTGIGIPLEKQMVIFERFIQADIADIQARQGAGLGLAIAKAFVELLGGKIWVESEEGKGSIFYFIIPFDQEPEKPNSDRQILTPKGATNKINDLKILIVEDDSTSEMLMSIMINEFGKEILSAKTGREAVEICRSNTDIDLVMMDIQMPVLNGYEATSEIRQFNKDVIIIAQTAFGLVGDREKAIEAGCNDYISKPISKEKLLALIQMYFKK